MILLSRNTHFPEFINIHQHTSHPNGHPFISQELTYVAKVFIQAWLKGEKDCYCCIKMKHLTLASFSISVCVCVAGISTDPFSFSVQAFPHHGQQLAQTLQCHVALILDECNCAAVDHRHVDHVELEKFTDEPHDSQQTLMGLVIGLFLHQLLMLGFLANSRILISVKYCKVHIFV